MFLGLDPCFGAYIGLVKKTLETLYTIIIDRRLFKPDNRNFACFGYTFEFIIYACTPIRGQQIHVVPICYFNGFRI